jgi:hypothetical protein
MISKKVILPMAAITLVGAGVVGIQATQAASGPNGPSQSLVQDIAKTFNLDPSKVQAVFTAHAQAQASESQTRYQDMLQNAVTNGKLTQAQMAAILAEHNALVSQLQAAQSQSGQAKADAIRAVYQDAKAWAEQNSVAQRWLLGPRRLRDRGPHVAPSPAPSPVTSPTPSS